MKLSLFTTAISGLFACSYAIPIGNVGSVVERAHEIDDLEVREWLDLETRSFAGTNADTRKNAHKFIDLALERSAIAQAATPSTQTKTYINDRMFHLDRQQPTNVHGDHKVAVQLNAGSPSTIGQVVIHKDHHITPEAVAEKLKESVDKGQELRVPHSTPKITKKQRIENNKALALSKQLAKKQRHADAQKKGMKRAAQGQFKKGRGKASAEATPYRKLPRKV